MLLDEFEANSPNAKPILDACRSAASQNSAPLLKGTSEGKAQLYQLTFAVLLSGIVANLPNEADRSRFVLLEMLSRGRDVGGQRRIREAMSAFGGDFGARVLRRMLDSLSDGSFDKTLTTLAEVIQDAGGDQRKADLFGHLLAGYCVLTREEELTENGARNLATLIADLDEDSLSDEEECGAHLLGHRVRIDYGYEGTIGEWIAAAASSSHSLRSLGHLTRSSLALVLARRRTTTTDAKRGRCTQSRTNEALPAGTQWVLTSQRSQRPPTKAA